MLIYIYDIFGNILVKYIINNDTQISTMSIENI